MYAVAVTFGYLIGSVPFAYLLSRRRGIDLRHVGSGNVGASNVLRTSGVRIAVLAMCLDSCKGALAVILVERLAASPSPGAAVAAGVASIIGHIYPMWLRFRGGKGVATAAGVFAVITPAALAVAGAVFVAGVWLTRYISVGSLSGTVALAALTVLGDYPATVALGATISAGVILYRHRANMVRLRRGTERRVGQRLSGLARPDTGPSTG
jgi:acyl phosphate:glycerol-3-phosphate acyltransferase